MTEPAAEHDETQPNATKWPLHETQWGRQSPPLTMGPSEPPRLPVLIVLYNGGQEMREDLMIGCNADVE